MTRIAAFKAISDPLTDEAERLILLCEQHDELLLPLLVSGFGWPVPEPEKPWAFNKMDDHDVLQAVKEAREKYNDLEKGKRLPSKERATLKHFGRWRGEVMDYERAVAGNILALLRAANSYHLNAEEDKAYKVLCFAEETYRFRATGLPIAYAELEYTAAFYSACPGFMSDKLLQENPRYGEKSEPQQLGIGGV